MATNTNHAKVYGLIKQLGLSNEEKELLVYSFSGEKTVSLKELAATNARQYKALVDRLQAMCDTMKKSKTPRLDAEADMWRKRVIAAVSAWLDATGVQPANKLQYIKEIVCRTSALTAKDFNNLTIAQLRTAYNSFVLQNRSLNRVNKATKVFTTPQN